MATGQTSNSKQDQLAKDAMFLLELMRDSPQAVLFHISPYCQKTGTKPNTIVKRLSEIKKRNKLNIITTTNPPGGHGNSYTFPKADNNGEAAPKGKRKRASQSVKQSVPEGPFAGPVNVETKDAHDMGTAYGLPSPAASAAGGFPAPVTASIATMAQIPSYMPQKRTLDDRDSFGFEAVNKKIKTEF
ncbi:hypothetical protein AYL99_08513 [Fonsecaea erecta]|uniref:Uncharacterized protein n=1 Tax=Fonsecaea erecta TaxID=1367422 RepID=A0A178ZFD6_9EURO|nr:hypothetical protein AYL99_08513 [Fonsecaea erecta]OAP57775.1 hypothetical protein AYL99_08513 [Fonsecaea erecta]